MMMGKMRSAKLRFRSQYERFSTRRKRTDYVKRYSPGTERTSENLLRQTTKCCDEYPDRGRRLTDFHPGGSPTTVTKPRPSSKARTAPRPENNVRETPNDILLSNNGSGCCIAGLKVRVLHPKLITKMLKRTNL